MVVLLERVAPCFLAETFLGLPALPFSNQHHLHLAFLEFENLAAQPMQLLQVLQPFLCSSLNVALQSLHFGSPLEYWKALENFKTFLPLVQLDPQPKFITTLQLEPGPYYAMLEIPYFNEYRDYLF